MLRPGIVLFRICCRRIAHSKERGFYIAENMVSCCDCPLGGGEVERSSKE